MIDMKTTTKKDGICMKALLSRIRNWLFSLTFIKTTTNEKYLNYEKNRLENKKYINFGHTVFKHFFFKYLYRFCIFDFSLVYGRDIQYIVVR